MQTPQPQRKSFYPLEIVFLLMAAMPGILRITGGPVENPKQAAFRVALFVFGLAGFIAVKMYQYRRKRPGNPDTSSTIIKSLIGARLKLVDDKIVEETTFWDDHVVLLYGPKDGACQTGPIFSYQVRLDGRINFKSAKDVKFVWNQLERVGDFLIVHCGEHSRDTKFFYRPIKRYWIQLSNAGSAP